MDAPPPLEKSPFHPRMLIWNPHSKSVMILQASILYVHIPSEPLLYLSRPVTRLDHIFLVQITFLKHCGCKIRLVRCGRVLAFLSGSRRKSDLRVFPGTNLVVLPCRFSPVTPLHLNCETTLNFSILYRPSKREFKKMLGRASSHPHSGLRTKEKYGQI